jgi:BirA family transcriptional regulator, biotin operon repressor / biotin---[acetyl-CoA-carboxylase] ligase
MSRLDAEVLRRGLSNCTIGREIVVLSETTSTNDAILQLAAPNNEEGLVIFAEYQTAGRGQRGNVWESASGKGLWLSILLRPKIHIKDSPRLTSWAAKIVATTIQDSTLLNAIVKPPNDVYVDGRKVGGVLVEMRAQKNAPHLAIVGIGVNVNHTPEDFSETLRSQAISLAMALDRQLDRNEFAIALLRDLDRTYPAVCSGDFGQNGTAVPYFKR